MIDKITTIEMEECLARYFNPRTSLIVPNISWGMNLHECDLLVVRKSGCAIEIEIKISREDLKKDQKKEHNHFDRRIRELYFAIPSYLEKDIDFIPEHAGIILISRNYDWGDHVYCRTLRNATLTKGHIKFTEKEMFNIARLGTMRIWGLKKKIISIKRKKVQKRIPAFKNQLSLEI